MSSLKKALQKFKAAIGYKVTVVFPESHDRKVSLSGGKLNISGLTKDDAEEISKGFRNWAKSSSYTADLKTAASEADVYQRLEKSVEEMRDILRKDKYIGQKAKLVILSALDKITGVTWSKKD